MNIRYAMLAHRTNGTLRTVPLDEAAALLDTGLWFLVCAEPDDLTYTPRLNRPARRKRREQAFGVSPELVRTLTRLAIVRPEAIDMIEMVATSLLKRATGQQ